MDNQVIDQDNPPGPTASGDQKFLKIVGILLRLVGFWILGPTLGLLVAALIMGIGPEDIALKLQDLSTAGKGLLLQVQGWGAVFMFFVLPLLYVRFFNKSLSPSADLKLRKPGIFLLLAVGILLASFPLVSWLQEINKGIDLPEFAARGEAWMKEKEAQAAKLTELLAIYNSPAEFWACLLVIAILPGIGEELLFRGIIQNEFIQVTRNPHFAVWITAFLFSAVHLQFYGLIPRMLLGVVLGYLYLWSGSLTISMLVHFLNNFIGLLLVNFYRHRIININPDSSESIPSYIILFSTIAFLFLLITFRKYRIRQPGDFPQG